MATHLRIQIKSIDFPISFHVIIMGFYYFLEVENPMKYPNTIKAEAVLFYERGHTFAETKAKYGMSESTFYEWKKKFDLEPPNFENIGENRSASRKAQLHLEKLSLELEVLQQCPCGILTFIMAIGHTES